MEIFTRIAFPVSKHDSLSRFTRDSSGTNGTYLSLSTKGSIKNMSLKNKIFDAEAQGLDLYLSQAIRLYILKLKSQLYKYLSGSAPLCQFFKSA